MNPHRIPPADAPPAHPHQVDAVRFATERTGALINGWMGTGKTRIAIDVARAIGAQRTLVLAPSAVLGVWEPQIARHHTGGAWVLTLDEKTAAAKGRALAEALDPSGYIGRGRNTPLIVIAGYESAWRSGLREPIANTAWDLVVADECHRIKAAGGKASQWLARVLRRQAARRLGLTGTPMPHGPVDIYAQARFLDPAIFGTSAAIFRKQWCRMGGFEQRQVVGLVDEDAFARRLAGMMLTIKADVMTLPPTTDTSIPVQLGAKAQRHYREIARDFITRLESGEIATAAMAATTILRLQQIGSGFIRDAEGVDHDLGGEKQAALESLMTDMGADEPVVVFGRFRRDLDYIHAAAAAVGRESYELSGRRSELDDWRERCAHAHEMSGLGAGRVFVVQVEAGGLGVDFTTCAHDESTRARYAVYYSLTHGLGAWEQSRARIHRPGQERTVHYYTLEAGVDRRIMKALGRKQDAVQSLVDYVARNGASGIAQELGI